MADNTIGWGQGSVNNTNDWGKGKANSTNDWGSIYANSPSGETNIEGGSPVDLDSFIIQVKTDNAGTSASNQFTLNFSNANSPTVNYDVDWGDGNIETGITSYTKTHTYAIAGTYTVSLTGQSGAFVGSGDLPKITDVTQWGTYQWNLTFNFRNATNLSSWSATDNPNLSSATSMLTAFVSVPLTTHDFSGWDVTTITNFANTFFNCDSFIGNGLDTWDCRNATNLSLLTNATGISTVNYDALLIAWDALGTYAFSGTANFGGSTYTLGGAAETARTSLIAKWGGIIDGGGVLDATTNLVASYNFDSDLSDYNGNYDGTTSGTITHSAFKVNDGGYFSGGNSDFVTLPNTNDAFTFHDGSGNDIPFSVSFWVEESGFAGSSGGIVGNCFWNNLKNGIKCGNDTSIQATQYSTSSWIKTNGAGSGFRGIVVKQLAFGLFLNNNQLVVYDWNASTIISTGVSLNDDNWHHVVFTFSSGVTNGAQIYIDGVATGSAFTYTISSQSSELAIGMGDASGTSQNFNGKIDEVHIWTNRILTASEVQNIYNTENVGNTILPSFSTNLAASYNFDSDVTDYTGVNNGTITSSRSGSAYFFVGNGINSRQIDIVSLISNNTIGFDIFDVNVNNRISYTASYTTDAEIKHIVATYDGSKTVGGLKFYVNGIEQGNLAVEVGTYTGMNSATQQTTNAGIIPSYTSYIFTGLIDELHVWKDRELSATEVLEIYNTEDGGTSILP